MQTKKHEIKLPIIPLRDPAMLNKYSWYPVLFLNQMPQKPFSSLSTCAGLHFETVNRNTEHSKCHDILVEIKECALCGVNNWRRLRLCLHLRCSAAHCRGRAGI